MRGKILPLHSALFYLVSFFFDEISGWGEVDIGNALIKHVKMSIVRNE